MFRTIRPREIKPLKREKSRIFFDINNYTKKNFNNVGILETPASFMSFFNGAIHEVYCDLFRPFKEKRYEKDLRESKDNNKKQELKKKVRTNLEKIQDFKLKLMCLLEKIKELIADLKDFLMSQRKDLDSNQIKEIEEEIREWEFVADNVLNTFINFISNTVERVVKPTVKKIE